MLAGALQIERDEIHAREGSIALLEQVVGHLPRD